MAGNNANVGNHGSSISLESTLNGSHKRLPRLIAGKEDGCPGIPFIDGIACHRDTKLTIRWICAPDVLAHERIELGCASKDDIGNFALLQNRENSLSLDGSRPDNQFHLIDIDEL